MGINPAEVNRAKRYCHLPVYRLRMYRRVFIYNESVCGEVKTLKDEKLREKEAIVEDLQGKFESAQSLIFIDYRGLTVAEATELRNTLRAAHVQYKVIKNTFIKRAAEKLGYGDVSAMLEGPTAVAYSTEDPVSPAKLLDTFIRTAKKAEIKGGVLDGKKIDAAAVKNLAELPSKEQLLAKMMGSLNAPITGLVMVLSGVMRNFVRVLDGIREQKSA